MERGGGGENIYNRMEKSEHIIETLHWLEVPNLLVENPHQKDIRNRGLEKRKSQQKLWGGKKSFLCVW